MRKVRVRRWLLAIVVGAVLAGAVAFSAPSQAIGASGDRVLYFGDHTYGDILRSKRSVGWRTAMIVPEVAAEAAVTTTILEDLAGNNVGKPFDVDLFDNIQRRLTTKTVTRFFTIR